MQVAQAHPALQGTGSAAGAADDGADAAEHLPQQLRATQSVPVAVRSVLPVGALLDYAAARGQQFT